MPFSTVSFVPLGTPLMDTRVEVRDEQGGIVTEGEGQVFIGETYLVGTHMHCVHVCHFSGGKIPHTNLCVPRRRRRGEGVSPGR